MDNNFEEKLKKVIFDKMYEIQDRDQIIIRELARIGKSVGIEPTSSNIARTATNKLILDIVPQFKKAGLKFYSDSIVSEAIYTQLIGYIAQGHKLLQGCNDSLDLDKEAEQQIQLMPSNKISRFFAKFRKLFVNKQKRFQKPNDANIEKAKSYIGQYEDLDQEVGQYNLRDNIIPALTKIICPKDGFIYLPMTVPELFDEDITPVLQKLGLGDLIPKLEQELVQAYTENSEMGLEFCVSPQEVELYVPNFEKYRAEKKARAGLNITTEQVLHNCEEVSTSAAVAQTSTEDFEQEEH